MPRIAWHSLDICARVNKWLHSITANILVQALHVNPIFQLQHLLGIQYISACTNIFISILWSNPAHVLSSHILPIMKDKRWSMQTHTICPFAMVRVPSFCPGDGDVWVYTGGIVELPPPVIHQ